MLPQPHHAFEFLHQQLDPLPSQVYTDNLPCGHRLGHIGHQDFGLFRPIVAPTCAEHHGDVSQMAHPTEAAIMEAMERLMHGRTTIMIAHRLSTLANCDALLEIKNDRMSRVTRSMKDDYLTFPDGNRGKRE